MIRTNSVTAAGFAACLLALTPSANASQPNSIKYNDSGIPNATATSTVASIEARALLNRNDSTDVEVTTGTFDGGAPSGYITKVKVGIQTDAGLLYTNFNRAEDATFSGNITGVISGDVLTVDASLRGDNNGTDHATAHATVTKRPDLRVASLSPPGVAVKGTIGRVRTTITELNRTVGARATVRLFIDSTEVDRAENIWVNAGGRVNVTFAPIIEAEAGRHNFTVVVDSMNPGDWDESNNTRTVPDVQVFNVLDEFYSWSASASEDEFSNYDYEKRSWTERTRQDDGVAQSFRFEGLIRAAVDFNTMIASASGESDGNPLFSVSQNEFSVFNTPVGTRCAISHRSPEVVACFNPNTSSVDVDINYGTADATYRSWGWATRQSPFSPEEPLFTWDDTRVEDSLQSRFGSTVALNFTIADAVNHWTATPFLSSLTTSTTERNSPYRCVFDEFTNETVCRETRNHSTIRQGSASGFAE